MNLSNNFTLKELTDSQTAVRLGFSEQFTPPQDVLSNLGKLCHNILEPLREKLGKPIAITSGYRCLRDNTAIGGAVTSQHVKGQAADTHVLGMSIEDWYQFVKHSDLPYDQIIQEFDAWVHISYSDTPRKMCLRAVKENGKTVYKND